MVGRGPALVAHLLAACLMAMVVLCFAEAGSLFEETGGPYLYARAAFGENYPRLTELKHKYDPTNFFRINQNIQPAA